MLVMNGSEVPNRLAEQLGDVNMWWAKLNGRVRHGRRVGGQRMWGKGRKNGLSSSCGSDQPLILFGFGFDRRSCSDELIGPVRS